ncbi:hypothetical protein IVB48_15535 [Bradyrhizobium sp. 76]|nr:hypothetical protein [Bradyrhizobium sp. 76]
MLCDGWCSSCRNARPTIVIDRRLQRCHEHPFVQAGQNDLRSTDASAWLAAFVGYLANFQEAIKSSRKIVQLGISTHNARKETIFNVNRAAADAALRRFPGEGKCDFVVDWAADPTWGPDFAAANQALYPDGAHPSQGGQSNMEANYFRPTLNSLFLSRDSS